MTDALDRPISMRLQTMLISGLVLLVASGALGWVVAQANSSQRLSDAIAANGVEIKDLVVEVQDLKRSNGDLTKTYVTQDTFAEFKSAADANKQETHDFQVRIDSKMDMLITDRSKSARQR